MNKLPETFLGTRDQNGPAGRYHFRLLKRTGDVALFHKHNPRHNPPKDYWEVVIIQTRPKHVWPDGKVTEAHESMPSPEEWGVLGYSPGTLEAANTRFDSLVAEQSCK